MSSSLTSIPIINFEPFINGGEVEKRSVAQQIYQACQEIGFLYLTHYGLSPALLQRMFDQSQQFFALPAEEKDKVAWSHAESNRGYGCTGRERLNPDRPGDYKETFNMGVEAPPIAASKTELPTAPPTAVNRWPTALPTFRQTSLEFFDACVGLANRVFQAMAIALDLPEDFFTTRHNQQPFTLRLLHYPPVKEPLAPEQVRAGEHSDYGTLTLLFQDEVGGLEVQTRAGEWIAASPIADTVLINLGDLMERWTNHVFRSTKHRVMPPLGAKAQQQRYSIAFFCDANPDIEVACLPSCQSAAHPPLYPPIRAGEYLLSRLNATY